MKPAFPVLLSHPARSFAFMCLALYVQPIHAQSERDVFGTYFNSGFNSLGITHFYPDYTYIDSTFFGKGIDSFTTVTIVKGNFTVQHEYHALFINFSPKEVRKEKGLHNVTNQSVDNPSAFHATLKKRCLLGSIANHSVFIPLDTFFTYKPVTGLLLAANYYNQYNGYVHGWYVRGLTIDSLNEQIRNITGHRPRFSSDFDRYFLASPVYGKILEEVGSVGAAEGNSRSRRYLLDKGAVNGVLEGMEFVADTKMDNTLTVAIVNEHTCIVTGRVDSELTKGAKVSTRSFRKR